MAETKKTTTRKTNAAKTATKTKTASKKSAAAKKTTEAAQPKHIGIVQRDPWLEPYENAIRGRHDHAV